MKNEYKQIRLFKNMVNIVGESGEFEDAIYKYMN